MVFSAKVRSAGLTTLFKYSEEKKTFSLEEKFNFLKDKKIGLIINHTSKVPKNELRDYNLSFPMTTYELFKNSNLNVIKIFTPEHGISGTYGAGEYVPSSKDIISLYGENKSPKKKHLDNIDFLIFDIQDIGVRYYTYISTMHLCMEKAAINDIGFIVLDRPNPLGRKIEGSVLDMDYKSFVGMNPIPVRHGMTPGELALFIKENSLIKNASNLDLTVIKGEKWDQSYSIGGRCRVEFEQTSPNIPSLKHALMYVGTCLLEGTNISEGRGTDNPFKLFGAPWLDSKKIINRLQEYNFKDVYFSEKTFTPTSSKYKGIECSGIQIDYEGFEIEAFRVGIAIIYEIFKYHSNEFEFKDDFFDKLYGSSDLRLAIIDGKDLNHIFKKNEQDRLNFINKKVEIY